MNVLVIWVTVLSSVSIQKDLMFVCVRRDFNLELMENPVTVSNSFKSAFFFIKNGKHYILANYALYPQKTQTEVLIIHNISLLALITKQDNERPMSKYLYQIYT